MQQKFFRMKLAILLTLVIRAVSGAGIGSGVPPPQSGLSLSRGQHGMYLEVESSDTSKAVAAGLKDIQEAIKEKSKIKTSVGLRFNFRPKRLIQEYVTKRNNYL